MPAVTRWSRRSSPIGLRPAFPALSITSAIDQVSPRMSGPRWPTFVCSSRTRSITGAAKHTATTSSVSSRAFACQAGRRHRSPRLYRCHAPCMRMWEWMARPLSKRIRRCLPTGWTSVMVVPARRLRRSGLAAVTRLPWSPWPSCAASRHIVSPSGISPLRYRPSTKTGVAAAIPARSCRARIGIACLGSRALGRRSVDKLFLRDVGGDVGHGGLDDLVEGFPAVAFEHFHPLVELDAGEVDVRLHALAEGPVLVGVVLPELADHSERRSEEIIHALVHDLPACWRRVEEAIEEEDAVADVTALVAGDVPDAFEQSGELVVGLERLSEAVVAGLGEHAFDDHVVGDRGPDLRLGRLVGLEGAERLRHLDEEKGAVARREIAFEVAGRERDLIEPAAEELDVLGLLP